MAARRADLPVTKKTSVFRLQPARDPRSPHTWRDDIGGLCHFAPLTFSDPISSFAA